MSEHVKGASPNSPLETKQPDDWSKVAPCPFCGNAPVVAPPPCSHPIFCNNAKCPLGPSRLIVTGLGKSDFEKKCFTYKDWHSRPAERESRRQFGRALKLMARMMRVFEENKIIEDQLYDDCEQFITEVEGQ